MNEKRPAIIVLSSHVVRGTVGNRAAAYALEVMGFPVWIVPTVILPWHPGHGPSERIVPASAQFDQLINDLASAQWLNEVGGVLSGYLGNRDQVVAVANLVTKIKQVNPNALYTLDPVIGDAPQDGEGRLYVSEEQATAMRDFLLPLADMITPNPFELGWMSAQSTPKTLDQIHNTANNLDVPTTLATSAPAMMRSKIGNLLVQKMDGKTTAHLCEHPFAKGPPNGLGDLAAALMMGNLFQSKNPVLALQQTSASLFEVMMIASRARSDELLLEASISSILNPRTKINASLLMQRKPT